MSPIDTRQNRDRFFLCRLRKRRYAVVSDWDPRKQPVEYNPPHRLIAIYDAFRWILGEEHHDVLNPFNDISGVDLLIATPDVESTGKKSRFVV
jgi:hypothetical protein